MIKSLVDWEPYRPFTVGFDSLWDRLQTLELDVPNYPPYNIIKTGKYTYDIQVALAGYGKKDVDVSFENSILTIKSVKEEEEKTDDKDGILHKGIAKRMFTKSFTIADEVEIKGAELKDGLLCVSMERVIPEHKKARTIKIK